MVIGYEFNSQIIFDKLEIAEEEVEVVYFTVEETTTNSSFSTSISLKLSDGETSLLPAQSDGINIMAAFSTTGGDTAPISLDTAPVPITVVVSLVVFTIFHKKREKRL